MNRSRHQLNLDITRKEVREHIMNQIFKVLDACKADYVKWDMNRSVDNVFSAALPKERQGEVYTDMCWLFMNDGKPGTEISGSSV